MAYDVPGTTAQFGMTLNNLLRFQFEIDLHCGAVNGNVVEHGRVYIE
jgi:hypothetical protein